MFSYTYDQSHRSIVDKKAALLQIDHEAIHGTKMAKKRYVTEMGMGVDVHGSDYTKAAKRAVSDAIRHSSLNFFKALGKSPNDMELIVKIGVAKPDEVNLSEIAKELPYGSVTVEVLRGGLDVVADEHADKLVMANAAVLVYLTDDD